MQSVDSSTTMTTTYRSAKTETLRKKK